MARESGYKFKMTKRLDKLPKGGYIDTDGYLIMPHLMRPREVEKYSLVDLNKGYTKLAIYRSSAGMRQSDLAREVGVSVRTIQGWEARGLNEARASKALKIAEILKCNIKDLMEDE